MEAVSRRSTVMSGDSEIELGAEDGDMHTNLISMYLFAGNHRDRNSHATAANPVFLRVKYGKRPELRWYNRAVSTASPSRSNLGDRRRDRRDWRENFQGRRGYGLPRGARGGAAAAATLAHQLALIRPGAGCQHHSVATSPTGISPANWTKAHTRPRQADGAALSLAARPKEDKTWCRAESSQDMPDVVIHTRYTDYGQLDLSLPSAVTTTDERTLAGTRWYLPAYAQTR